MTTTARSILLSLLLCLCTAAVADAQPSVVVRGLTASTGGSDPVLATRMPGVGVGVVMNEHLELFAEFAQARDVSYPPRMPSASGTSSASTPVFVEIYSLVWSRLDRRALGGGRLTTSRRIPAWAYAEVSGGMLRRWDVLYGSLGERSEVSTNPVVFIGGGVGVRAGHLEAEAGYRVGLEYHSWSSDNARATDAHASVGVRF